jgi:hypothetical protein
MGSDEVYIWGAGHAGRAALRRLRGRDVRGIIDSDPARWGRLADGVRIVAPSAVLGQRPKPFIAIASMFEDEIAASLVRAGWFPGIDFASAADVAGAACDDAAAVFTDIYAGNTWGNGESRSGGGSSMCATEAVRLELPRLLRDHGIRSVLDAPCGDVNWMRWLLPQIGDYTGLDIVAPLIDANQARYGSTSVRFLHGDVSRDVLPAADLILVRDCLVHLPTRAALEALRNVARTQASYVLTTTFPACEQNRDVLTGGWRPLNLQRAPFEFGEPLAWIHERAPGPDGAFADKALALWSIAELRRLPFVTRAA